MREARAREAREGLLALYRHMEWADALVWREVLKQPTERALGQAPVRIPLSDMIIQVAS